MNACPIPPLVDSHTQPNAQQLSEQSMPADQLLTVPEIAQLTNRSLDTVRYWRQYGRGPKTFRRGNRVYARKSDVLAWLASREEEHDFRGGI